MRRYADTVRQRDIIEETARAEQLVKTHLPCTAAVSIRHPQNSAGRLPKNLGEMIIRTNYGKTVNAASEKSLNDHQH